MLKLHGAYTKQGRIRDLKLGVAQTGWKIWKQGGGGDIFANTIIYQSLYFFSNTIHFNYDFFITLQYAPLCNITMKIVFEKITEGVRSMRPL